MACAKSSARASTILRYAPARMRTRASATAASNQPAPPVSLIWLGWALALVAEGHYRETRKTWRARPAPGPPERRHRYPARPAHWPPRHSGPGWPTPASAVKRSWLAQRPPSGAGFVSKGKSSKKMRPGAWCCQIADGNQTRAALLPPTREPRQTCVRAGETWPTRRHPAPAMASPVEGFSR